MDKHLTHPSDQREASEPESFAAKLERQRRIKEAAAARAAEIAARNFEKVREAQRAERARIAQLAAAQAGAEPAEWVAIRLPADEPANRGTTAEQTAQASAATSAEAVPSAPPHEPLREKLSPEAWQRMQRVRDVELSAEPAPRVSVGATAPLEADQEAAEEISAARRSLNDVRAKLGTWTRDSARRLEEQTPEDAEQAAARDRLGAGTWAVCRLAMTGNQLDLAYALDCMLRMMGGRVEVLGAFVCQAMGLGWDGHCERQLWTCKARRQLVRSFAAFKLSQPQRRKDIEPRSTSDVVVRGLRRCPQKLLAKVCAIGDLVWSRSTTARDASDSHRWGVWKRIRLTVELAPAEERSGPSGQVVSRYSMAAQLHGGAGRGLKQLSAIAAKLTKSDGAGSADQIARAWVREVGEHAIRFACGLVPQLDRLRFAAFPFVQGLMEPELGSTRWMLQPAAAPS